MNTLNFPKILCLRFVISAILLSLAGANLRPLELRSKSSLLPTDTCSSAAAAKPIPIHKYPQNALSSRAGGSDGIRLSKHSAVAAGMLLAFNAGYVNGACLSGFLSSGVTKQPTAAVTGAWTNGALGLASGDRPRLSLNAGCILSYVGGSFLSGLFLPRPALFELGRDAASAFGIGAALLAASAHMTANGSKVAFLYPATAANGLQNGITSSLTANLIRSSHMSGTTSDIGTFLGQIVRGNYQNATKLKVLLCLALSFWVGSFLSYFVTEKMASSSLLVSAGLYLSISLGILAKGGL